MDINITHADAMRREVRYLTAYQKLDAQMKSGGRLSENSYSLQLMVGEWVEAPIQIGNYIYIAGTEWGGPVDVVTHNTESGVVTLQGPLWRGLLMQRAVEPELGETHRVIAPMDANDALRYLLGDAFDGLFVAEEEQAGVTVEGKYRYTTLLEAMEGLLEAVQYRLCITYNAARKCAVLSAEPIADYSDEVDLSQDYGIGLKATSGRLEGYNRVLALGGGEMLERTVVSLYRLPGGEIVTEKPEGWDDKNERCAVYDYGSVESDEDLIKGAMQRMEEYSQLTSFEMNTGPSELSLRLLDKVGARDRVTGMVATAKVLQIVLLVDARGLKIQTKVG